MSSSDRLGPDSSALNPPQHAAVYSDAARILVLAGAGTGKTRTLTHRVARLIGDGVEPERILLATFTHRAAREMQIRVDRLLRHPRRPVCSGTFHALAYRMLREHARQVGLQDSFTIVGREEQVELIRGAATECATASARRRLPSARDILAIKSLAADTCTVVHEVIQRRFADHVPLIEPIEQVLEGYERSKRALAVVDFDDLLLRWRDALAGGGDLAAGVGADMAHVLVDEYQDTSALQAEVADLLTHQGAHLCVVGDDAQSIFAFRGARFDNVLDFPRARPTEVHTLAESYRSDPAILAVANATIAANPLQFPKELAATRPHRAKPVVVSARDPEEEASFVAQRILDLHEAGCSLSEQAVLYRAHAHVAALELELVRRNIPYRIRSGVRLLEQAHVRDALAFLRIEANRSDVLAWKRIEPMLTGVGKEGLRRLIAAVGGASKSLGSALLEFGRTTGLTARARRSVLELGQLFERLGRVSRPADQLRILILDGYEALFVDHLERRYRDAAARAEDLRNLATMAGSYANTEDLLAELALIQDLAPDRRGGRERADRLTLSTIHQAKGLEWGAVFVIHLVEQAFPNARAEREPDGLAEERRLFYVAVTRAKDELYLSHPTSQRISEREQVHLRPSRFVSKLAPSLYDRWTLT